MNATISLIIPAHNEAKVIGRTLENLKDAFTSGELAAYVVCNGCTDETAHIAHRYPVQVIETPISSKTGALNLGDQAAGALFPRIYLDADVDIAWPTIRALAERLRRGDVFAAAPSAVLDMSECSLMVRWYYRIASLLPASREGVGGSGVYALSEAGRKCFNRFPAVIADDAFVRIHFRKSERTTLNCPSYVFPPRTIRHLIRTRIRVHAGHVQLAKRFPQLWEDNGASGNIRGIVGLFNQITIWPPLFVYCMITIAARLAARWMADGEWLRDETARGGNR